MSHKLLIHGIEDNVGVAVQDIKIGDLAIAVYLDSNNEITIASNHDISLGHKIALKGLKVGELAVEYGEIIGKVTEDINKGDWVHIHNLKSARL
jgi:(2R)-sulfolactate sulfo-lyase subunit alpha